MKKFLALLTAALLVVGCFGTTAFAAETWGGLTIKASETTVEVGDTVEYTITLDDCSKLAGGVYNLGFYIEIPEGLEYVSGELNPAFEDKTGIERPSFNENTLKVGALGALAAGYTGSAIDIITFECKAVAAGDATITLSGANFTDVAGEKTPAIKTTTVKVAEKAEVPDTPVIPDTPDEPVVPDTPDEPVVPDTPVEPEKPATPDDGKSPATGDNGAMAGIAVVCVAAVAGVAVARKRMMA